MDQEYIKTQYNHNMTTKQKVQQPVITINTTQKQKNNKHNIPIMIKTNCHHSNNINQYENMLLTCIHYGILSAYIEFSWFATVNYIHHMNLLGAREVDLVPSMEQCLKWFKICCSTPNAQYNITDYLEKVYHYATSTLLSSNNNNIWQSRNMFEQYVFQHVCHIFGIAKSYLINNREKQLKEKIIFDIIVKVDCLFNQSPEYTSSFSIEQLKKKRELFIGAINNQSECQCYLCTLYNEADKYFKIWENQNNIKRSVVDDILLTAINMVYSYYMNNEYEK